MAVERTPRVNLHRWPLGTDPFTRGQMNLDHDSIENLMAISRQGTMLARPAAGVRGTFYFVADPGNASDGVLFYDDGVTWLAVNRKAVTLQVPHTFTVSGDVYVPNGDNFYVPPMYVAAPTGQTARLKGARAAIRSGTSASWQLRRVTPGGTSTIALGPVTTTPAAATTAVDGPLTDGDALNLEVTAVSGAPKNLSVTIFIDYAV